MKPKIFRSKKAALEAIEECQRNGWKAGIMGSGPWYVQAIHTGNGLRIDDPAKAIKTATVTLSMLNNPALTPEGRAVLIERALQLLTP